MICFFYPLPLCNDLLGGRYKFTFGKRNDNLINWSFNSWCTLLNESKKPEYCMFLNTWLWLMSRPRRFPNWYHWMYYCLSSPIYNDENDACQRYMRVTLSLLQACLFSKKYEGTMLYLKIPQPWQLLVSLMKPALSSLPIHRKFYYGMT